MNIFVSALLVATSFFGFAFTDTPKVTSDDLQRLTGAQWTGQLTYLDYRSNKKISIRSNLKVTQSAVDKLSWVFAYQYPDEPKADSNDTITISADGKMIDGEQVVERSVLAGNTLKIVTEKTGTDNDKKAIFRFTYLLNPTSFSIKKEVRHEGSTELFERNQYSWQR